MPDQPQSRFTTPALAAMVVIVAIIAIAAVLIGTRGSSATPARVVAAPPVTVTTSSSTTTSSTTTQARRPQHGGPRTTTTTVTAPGSTTVVQATPTPNVVPGTPPGMTACDQNISVNSATSCPFADAVFRQYATDVQQAGSPGSFLVDAYSPATGSSYTDSCQYNTSTQIVMCSHGSDLVQFPEWAAAVYHG